MPYPPRCWGTCAHCGAERCDRPAEHDDECWCGCNDPPPPPSQVPGRAGCTIVCEACKVRRCGAGSPQWPHPASYECWHMCPACARAHIPQRPRPKRPPPPPPLLTLSPPDATPKPERVSPCHGQCECRFSSHCTRDCMEGNGIHSFHICIPCRYVESSKAPSEAILALCEGPKHTRTWESSRTNAEDGVLGSRT